MSEERFIAWHTIYGVDGEHETPYMTRIWIGRLRLHIFHRGDADPDPHDHPWDFWTFPLTSYVEEITIDEHAAECDLNAIPGYALHLGFAIERRVVRAFRLHFRPARHLHRVLGRFTGDMLWDWPGRQRGQPPVPFYGPGKIITLVWRGRASRKWGFLKNRDGKWCWIGWRDYVFGSGKHAPCEPGGDA